MPIILAIQEAEMRRIMVQSQFGQIVCETLSRKKKSQKTAGGVAQGIGPEFKHQYYKKKKKESTGLFMPNCMKSTRTANS
jgi:hypothetical protein